MTVQPSKAYTERLAEQEAKRSRSRNPKGLLDSVPDGLSFLILPALDLPKKSYESLEVVPIERTSISMSNLFIRLTEVAMQNPEETSQGRGIVCSLGSVTTHTMLTPSLASQPLKPALKKTSAIKQPVLKPVLKHRLTDLGKLELAGEHHRK